MISRTGDINFFKEYVTIMKPVAVSLDILQGEDKAYAGILLPVLTVCLRKLTAARASRILYCEPLLNALLNGIKARFAVQLNDEEFILAAAFHPQFKLKWWEGEEEKLRAVKTKMINLVRSKLISRTQKSCSSSDEEERAETAETFFSDLRKFDRNVDEAEQLVSRYLEEPVSTSLPDALSFPCVAFTELFRKYNTPIPSSAAVERLFSLGKDILKPKRARLSDEHFEMLVFLKGNML